MLFSAYAAAAVIQLLLYLITEQQLIPVFPDNSNGTHLAEAVSYLPASVKGQL